MASNKKPSPVISVLNLKGGVGKTTTSANVFYHLARAGRHRVLLVDIDPQFNLTQTVLDQQQYKPIVEQGNTIRSVLDDSDELSLFTITQTNEIPPGTEQLAITLKGGDSQAYTIDLVPGDFGLVKYSLTDQDAKLKVAQKRLSNFITSERDNYDVICIDCNPSSSFLTQCALSQATHILVPISPDRYSVLGLQLLLDYMDHLPWLQPRPGIVIVMNCMERGGSSDPVETELRAHPNFGDKVLASRIYRSRLLSADPKYTGFASDKPLPHRYTLSRELFAVARELISAIGLDK